MEVSLNHILLHSLDNAECTKDHVKQLLYYYHCLYVWYVLVMEIDRTCTTWID